MKMKRHLALLAVCAGEALDENTHRGAHRMQFRRSGKNGRKAIASFQKLQSSCLACHQAFRPAFLAHFMEHLPSEAA